MKCLASALLIAVGIIGLAGLTGCDFSTPAYSASERFAQVDRNWYYDSQQFDDDWDHFWLTRPSDQLTIWHVYHRN